MFFYANAQSSSTLMGARAMSIGSTSSCLSDEWSLFNNVGGLGNIKDMSAGFTYRAYPSIKSFNTMAAVFATPVKYGVVATGVYRFGDDLYNEQILSGAFSNRFGLASLGLKFNYVQYHADGFGTKGIITISFGGIAQLTDKLSIGAHITNINQPQISRGDKSETVPSIVTAGLSYEVSDKFLVSGEIEKNLAFPVRWRTGMEYKVHPKVSLRTGFNLHPSVGSFGFGFKPKKFTLDYAYEYNFNLGANHQATVGYKFKSK
jgi:hypothetical protein